MGKMSDYVIECQENEHLIHEAFKKFLDNNKDNKAYINREILTDVLENTVDVHSAKQEWFEINFLKELENYLDVMPEMFVDDLWQVNKHCHDVLYSEFEEFLQDM